MIFITKKAYKKIRSIPYGFLLQMFVNWFIDLDCNDAVSRGLPRTRKTNKPVDYCTEVLFAPYRKAFEDGLRIC